MEKRAKAWQLTNEERFTLRVKRSQPILNKMKAWLDERKNENLPSKLKITEANSQQNS